LLMPNSKHLTHGISNLVSLITKTKLGLSKGLDETEPALLGSGEMELMPLGSGEIGPVPSGSGESESSLEGSDKAVVVPLIVRVN
jgi:hypothetical protein